MPSLFDLCSNQKSIQNLKDLKTQIEMETYEMLKVEYEEREKTHKEKHIFERYEDALDWLMQYPGYTIEWHCKTLHFDETNRMFISFEQDYSPDGVVPYDVVRKYTRQQLLDEIWELKEKIRQRGLDIGELYDKYGKLDYVYVSYKLELD